MAQVLIDGFSTIVELAGCSLYVCEKTVTPPEVDAGTAIDITTMRNTKWRTFAPKFLMTLGQMTFTAAYDPQAYAQAIGSLGQQVVGSVQAIRVIFPNGRAFAFYGYVEKFSPQEIKEGEQPIVTVTITPTNWNGLFTSGGCPYEFAPVVNTATSPGGGFRSCGS